MRNTTYKAITEAQAESKAPRFLGIHNPKNELQSRALLYMHIYAGSINLTGTVGTEDFTMINNETITISTEQDMISIRPGMSGDVEVIEPNIVTENGVSGSFRLVLRMRWRAFVSRQYLFLRLHATGHNSRN